MVNRVAFKVKYKAGHSYDEEWEETAVTFGTPDKSCGLDQKPAAKQTTPLHWVDTATSGNQDTTGSGPDRPEGNVA